MEPLWPSDDETAISGPTKEYETTDSPSLTSTATVTAAPALSPAVSITTMIIGYSYDNRPLSAYRFGAGSQPIVLVGGIHGGYEWNTILLAYEAIDFFIKHPKEVPEAITLYIIPAANPDGQYAVTGREGRFKSADVAESTVPGRFNGRGVDLNRNWDCQWSATATWSGQPVDAGAAPFSEPESKALRQFLVSLQPAAVIFFHSAAGGVYAAGCTEMFPPSKRLAEGYAAAAGYPVFDEFEHYAVTGDAGSWLAAQGIPAISVELATHEDLEWEKNRLGILAVLQDPLFSRPDTDIPHQLPVRIISGQQ